METPSSAAWLPAGTFQDEVVLITGGGTGLGLEISRGFAHLGATVVVASRSAENRAALMKEAGERGWKVEEHDLDVREDGDVRTLVDRVVESHGRIHHLVNNAAGNFVCPTEKLSMNAWRAVLGIVLDGTFSCSRHVGRHMLESGGGTMMNIVATYAWTGMPGVAHSASAKAGVLALTKTLAAEWAHKGIRVNAIAPGPFHSDGAKQNLWPDDEVERKLQRAVPLGRFAHREEVAALALNLCSPASDYITGECVTIDGGLTLAAGKLFDPRMTRKARADR